jgi:hypothetical protein
MKNDTFVVEIGDEKHVGIVMSTKGTKVKVQWHTGLTKTYPKKKVREATPAELSAAKSLWHNIELLAQDKVIEAVAENLRKMPPEKKAEILTKFDILLERIP